MREALSQQDEGARTMEIPKSGPKRRRAKALRNKAAVEALNTLAGPAMRKELLREAGVRGE